MICASADNHIVVPSTVEKCRQGVGHSIGTILSVDAFIMVETLNGHAGLLGNLIEDLHQAGVICIDAQATLCKNDFCGLGLLFGWRHGSWRRGGIRRFRGFFYARVGLAAMRRFVQRLAASHRGLFG